MDSPALSEEEKLKDLDTNMCTYNKRPGKNLQYGRENGRAGHFCRWAESSECDTMLYTQGHKR